jgi:pimeloyl-ACP methyl ester carboxylesterase
MKQAWSFRRGGDQPSRGWKRWAVGGLGSMAILFAVAMQTVPEFILFKERLVLSVLQLESRIDFAPLDLSTHDGLLIRSWYRAPQPGKPVIVYFPGRNGDIVGKPSHLFDLAEDGYGLVLAGYRGYGSNPGRPSESNLYRDATGLLMALAENQRAPDGIVLYGYSMGTGIASYLAPQIHPRALILEAPFTSFRDVVRRQAGPLPLWLVRTKFDTRSRIAKVDAPILILAGQDDWVTPPDFAETLASLSEGMSSLQIIPGANHVNIIRKGAREVVTGFLHALQPASAFAAEP